MEQAIATELLIVNWCEGEEINVGKSYIHIKIYLLDLINNLENMTCTIMKLEIRKITRSPVNI